ncbi:MAG: nucleotidyltransferase, partial [Blastocatellia bacterium]
DSLEALVPTGEAYGLTPRMTDAIEFTRTRRVLLLEHSPTGVAVDISCGALPFESEMMARARSLKIGTLEFKVAAPEDLIVMKAVAHRPKDIADIEAILNIQANLDFESIRFWVSQFAEALEMPEMMETLEKLLNR